MDKTTSKSGINSTNCSYFDQNNREKLASHKNIELFSEEVQEILGQPPSWIVRWGGTIFFFIILLVLIGSTLFKYPDTIKGSVVIVSENLPVPIMAQATGKIESIFIKDQEIVKPYTYLAVVENTANYEHILILKEKLEEIRKSFIKNDFSYFIEFPNNFSLGTVQQAFSNFQRQYEDYRIFLEINAIDKKIEALNKQIIDYKKYSEILVRQAENSNMALNLQHKQYYRDSMLYLTGVFSTVDFEKSEQSYLQVKNNYQSIQASLVNTKMQINQLQYQVIDLQNQFLDEKGTKISALKEAMDNLINGISIWEKNYVLISPINGKISYISFWSQNQYVVSGHQVFTVLPAKPEKIIGKVKFSVEGAGKVEKGQKVLIQLDNFPYSEFGMLIGKIVGLSLVPESTDQGTFYNAKVIFEKGLTTSYGKALPLNQNMRGSAEIMTKNLSVFQRLTSRLKWRFQISL